MKHKHDLDLVQKIQKAINNNNRDEVQRLVKRSREEKTFLQILKEML